MNRRSLLQATAAGTAVFVASGCLSRSGLLGDDSEFGDEVVPIDDIDTPTVNEHCNPVSLPLSAKLGTERRDPDRKYDPCFDDATTSLGLENERDEAISVTVTIESDTEGNVFEESYELESNERRVERNTIPAHDDLTVTVDVTGDESVTGSWEGASCYRHGIAILPSGVAIGYIEPFWGVGDTQYDCYAGDDSHLAIFNRPNEKSITRTVHVRIHDKCREETFETTLDIEPEGVETVGDLLTVGGDFEITVAVEDGGTASEQFNGVCGGTSAAIRDGGEIDLRDYIA